MITAHLAGMPVEELLPSLAGPVAGLLLAKAWLAATLGRRRDSDR
jgi:hypothetical protein